MCDIHVYLLSQAFTLNHLEPPWEAKSVHGVHFEILDWIYPYYTCYM